MVSPQLGGGQFRETDLEVISVWVVVEATRADNIPGGGKRVRRASHHQAEECFRLFNTFFTCVVCNPWGWSKGFYPCTRKMINTQLLQTNSSRMSDSKGNIFNYRWRSIFTQGIATFTTQALGEIWKDMILGIGGGTETAMLALCNPKAESCNLLTWELEMPAHSGEGCTWQATVKMHWSL